MRNFKKFLYCFEDVPMFGMVYHDHEHSQAVFTDGRFMIVSKELFDDSKDVETIKKSKCPKSKEFDYHNFNYIRAIRPFEDYEEIDCGLFQKNCGACESLFDSSIRYNELTDTKAWFKDFDFVLTISMIHVVNTFFAENEKLAFRVYKNKNVNSNLKIEAIAEDMMGGSTVVNTMYFMPVAEGYDYTNTVENGNLNDNCGIFHDNTLRYTYSEMADALVAYGIPHSVVGELADPLMASLIRRPVLNLVKFDDYLHKKYGEYESEGKSTQDLFKELFKSDTDKIAYFFGIECKE